MSEIELFQMGWLYGLTVWLIILSRRANTNGQ